jgi:hypothetical protein
MPGLEAFAAMESRLAGRQLAVPVHDGGCARLIHKIDMKALAGRERHARVSVRPDETEYSGRFAR